MDKFLITYAPFIVLILSIVIAFWVAPKDKAATKK